MSPIDKPSPENVFSGLLRNGGYTRLKGVMHVERKKDGTVRVKAWPKKRGASTDPAQILRNQQFAARMYYASDPVPLDAIMARMMVPGSPFLYRDYLYKQQVGTLFTVITKDGQVFQSWRIVKMDQSNLLDAICNTPGAMLVRGPSAWMGLLPGNLGDVLTSNGAGLAPAWLAGSGGGGGGGIPPCDAFVVPQFDPASTQGSYSSGYAVATPIYPGESCKLTGMRTYLHGVSGTVLADIALFQGDASGNLNGGTQLDLVTNYALTAGLNNLPFSAAQDLTLNTQYWAMFLLHGGGSLAHASVAANKATQLAAPAGGVIPTTPSGFSFFSSPFNFWVY